MYLSYICIPFITFFLKQVVFEAFYIMYTINGSYKVRQSSKCAGDTEYSCLSCPSDLCAECRENHIHDLDTIDHNVVIYREKIYQNSTRHEVCSKHPDNDYEMYCEPCELPVCFYCAESIK